MWDNASSIAGYFLSLTLSSLVPILATATGGMFAERARATNIALDGCMLVSALAAIATGAGTGNPWFGLGAAIVCGAAFAGILAFAAFALRCDLIIAGIAGNLLAVGVTLLVLRYGLGSTGTYAPAGVALIPRVPLGPLANVPIIGLGLNNQNGLLYIAAAAAILGTVVMNGTRFGLHVKAVGESDEAALAVGIKPVLIRTVALLISGALSGVGGAYLSMSSVASFNSQLTGGLGFIAFAAVIFGRSTPLGTSLAALLFAVATSLSITLQGAAEATKQLVHALPYIVTVAALALQSIRRSRRLKFGVSETIYVPAIIPRG